MSTELTHNEGFTPDLGELKEHIIQLEKSEKVHLDTIRGLKEREETFKTIFRIAPAGMGMLRERMFIEINPKVSEITGYSREELVGKSTRILYASDKEYNYIGREKYRQIKRHGIGSVETVWKRKDGVLIDIRFTLTPIAANDLSKGVIFTALDITKEKRDERALQSSKEKLKLIFEHAPDAIYLSDLEGKIIDGNKAGKELLGYDRNELVGENYLQLDLLFPQDKEKAAELLQQNRDGLKAGPSKFKLTAKNGDKKVVELISYPVNINNTKMVLGVARDITQRLKEEEVRRANEQRMAFHVNQTPLAVIEWDLNFNVRSWNPSAESIFGYTKEEAIGKNVSFILPESEYARVEQVLSEIINLTGRGKGLNKNKRKNGETIVCEWFNTPLMNEDGEVIAVASLGLDITKRVRHEEVQKVVYNISNAANESDNLNNLIGTIQNELSTIIDTKNFFIALYDKKSNSFSLPFFADEQDRFSTFPAGKTLTAYMIKNKKPLLITKDEVAELEMQGEVESVGSDSEIWMGVPLIIDNEVIGALVVQSYDDPHAYNNADLKMLKFVSNQVSLSIHKKNSELELVEALKRATEADKLKSAFLANMSHEIRTPMNGIMGFANLLKSENLSHKERDKYISIIEKSGSRMLGTINDLIDISKIESGIAEMQTSDFNLNESLEYVYSFFKPEAELKGLKLSYYTGLDNDDAVIKSDNEKLYAVVINLVKNSIKYSNSGEIKFGYTIRNNQIHFEVQDSGIGIRKEMLGSIFNRFVQVDSSLTRSTEGVGLGLPITKAFVELLGGKIWVESEYQKGSTFYFEIPFVRGENINILKESDTDTMHNKPKRKLNILVAEDDLINQKLFSYILKDVSNELIIEPNGARAVETFKKRSDIDLILMDLKMPEMDGYEATENIREINKDIKIIALSAFALETERKKALASGFTSYLSKPVSRADLLKAIGKFFEI